MDPVCFRSRFLQYLIHSLFITKEKAQVSGLELEIPQQELEVVTARRQTKTEDLMYKIDDIPPW